MIESGTIVELANKKKYIVTDGAEENGHVYYLTLEVDYDSEIPKEKSVFFEHVNDTFIPVTNEADIIFLKQIFVDRFLNEYIDDETIETV